MAKIVYWKTDLTGGGAGTLAGEKDFEIRHKCQIEAINVGFGVECNSVLTVDHETYTQVWIKKVG